MQEIFFFGVASIGLPILVFWFKLPDILADLNDGSN